ncbi:hypothetical protein HYQ46_007574 [Verticillium longisporum]|nr:hypothetical protein HYQ46_007574 [Verticillium longisporum]
MSSVVPSSYRRGRTFWGAGAGLCLLGALAASASGMVERSVCAADVCDAGSLIAEVCEEGMGVLTGGVVSPRRAWTAVTEETSIGEYCVPASTATYRLGCE